MHIRCKQKAHAAAAGTFSMDTRMAAAGLLHPASYILPTLCLQVTYTEAVLTSDMH